MNQPIEVEKVNKEVVSMFATWRKLNYECIFKN